jgi:hypothetical protein
MSLYNRSVGRHTPICCGQCLIAKTGCLNMCPLSTVLIIGPSYLWYYLFYSTMSPFILLLIAILFFGSLSCLFTAYLTEPGLLPTVDEDVHEDVGNKRPSRPKKLVVLPGEDKRSELLEFRAKYCRDTGNTIEKFDHFCPWTGNGVGVRNYRYYFCFLVFTTALALGVMATSAVAALNADSDSSIVMIAWLLVVYCALILCLVGGLLAYHIPLVSKNMTTNEDIKSVYKERNPYDRGCKTNWYFFILSTITCPRESYVCSDPTPGLHLESRRSGYDRCYNDEGEDNELLRSRV